MSECSSDATELPVELSPRGFLRPRVQGVHARFDQGLRRDQQLVRLVYLSGQPSDLSAVGAVATEGRCSQGGCYRISLRARAESISGIVKFNSKD